MANKTQEQPVKDEQTTQQPEEQEVAHLTDALKRTQAEFANYRRRTEEQQQELRKRAAQSLITDMLSVYDTLSLAIMQTPKDQHNELYKGVEMVLGQFMSMLEEHGVKTAPTKNFDPKYHEAILTEPSDEPKGTILEVLQQGFVLHEQPVRTAKVKLSAGPAGASGKHTEQ